MRWKLEISSLSILLLSIIIIAVESAPKNPLKDPRICGRPECELDTNKFKYNPNKRYRYDYIMEIRTEFAGSGNQTSDIKLKAAVDLTFPTTCEGVLKVEYVKLLKKLNKTDTQNEEDSVDVDNKNTDSDTLTDYYLDWRVSNDESNNDDDNNGFKNEDELHPKSYNLSKEIEKFSLRFSFHDGLISEVCPHADESNWVLNFKKGILSALQNTMLRFDVDLNTTETDVSGSCNVVYTLEGAEGTSVLIEKVKNVNSCKERNKMHSLLQTSPYSFRDDKSIWPILNSESYCNMTVDHNIYKSLYCYEKHQLIPFSNNKSGAVTESIIKLDLQSEENYKNENFYDFDAEIDRRSSLLFDHTPLVKPTHGEIRAARDLLQQMCDLGFPNIQREFIDVFTKFLQTTRLLSYKALHELLSRSGSICKNENGKNHVLESLPYIGSTASVQIMRDQIVAETIPKDIRHSWMTTLAFLQRPDAETLETFSTLLEYGKKNADPEYTLGATAVVHSFCRHNPECERNKKIQMIVKHLESEFDNLLSQYSRASKNNKNPNSRRIKERVIVILKGLGNIGIITKRFAERLQNAVIQNENVPIEIRLQAVAAFHRVDCFKHRTFFLDVYQNFTENSEIRILSYLQAMHCPDYISMQVIRRVLETEEVNQVGSYVWSHLKNIAKSASPVRVEAQGLLINDDLGTKFQMDIRKFSRNFEYSLFFDEYNFGTATDANLIFGTDSYLPRMATLNFTADLFGESVNFFEISLRTQGFEQLVSSIFGPKGPLNAEMFRKKFSFLNSIIGETSSTEESDFGNLENFRLKRESGAEEDDDSYNFEDERNIHRGKRSSPSIVDQQKMIRKDIDNLGYKLKYDYSNPRAEFGLKVFGNDLRYYTIEGIQEVLSAADKFNPIKQIAFLLSGKEFTYTKSGVFLDASYNVPMSSGLPLAIHAFGASSIDLRMSGKYSSKDQGNSNSWSFDIEGKLKPSISVDVLTTMESDFFFITSGIRVKSNLYSSSSVEAKLKVENTKLIALTLSLPQDKNEIFSAKSELLVMNDLEGEDIPQTGIANRFSNSTCTWPILDQAIGLRICSYYSLPDVSNATKGSYPGLLLSGPINFDVHLEKADPTAKTFVFEFRWDKSLNTSQGLFKFQTPGSAIPRILTTNYIRDPENVNISMSLINGNSSHSAVGYYNSNPDNRKLEVYFDSNGRKHLSLEMNVNRTALKNGWVYYPKFLLTVNEERIAGLVGTVKITEKSGIIQNDIDLTFETKKVQARCLGYVTKTEVAYSTKMKMDYRFQANKIESIEMEGELSDRSQKGRTEYKSKLNLITSAYPSLNFAANGTLLSLLGHTEVKLIHNNAPDFTDPKFSTTIRLILARSESDEPKSEGYRTKGSIEIFRPKSNIDFRILLKHDERYKHGPIHNFLGAVRYAPRKEATALFSIFFPRRPLFAVDATMNVTIPTFDSCTARIIVIEKNISDYSIDFKGAWFSGHSVTLKGTYIDKSTRIRSHHQLKLAVKSPSFEDTSISAVYRRNEAEIFADVQTEYGKDPYGLTINYSTRENDQKNTFVELKIREKSYWLSSKLTTKQAKQLLIEIHLDKVRDIHLKMRGLSAEKRKEASIELKWDANRDPSQRLAMLAEFNNPESRKYDATVMLTYPDRTFSGNFDISTGGPKYHGNARASWSSNEAIDFRYELGFSPNELKNVWILVEVNTPFEGWKKNGLNGGVYYHNNLLLMNASMHWADNQNICLTFKGDYEIKDPIFSCEVFIAVNSTIQDVPTISAKFLHRHDLKKISTDMDLRYSLANESLQVYSTKSDWSFDKNTVGKSIKGSVILRSPFKGYRTGALYTKWLIFENTNIRGGAKLNFEERQFTLYLQGYIRKLTDNMLAVNITTPIDKFRTIIGRLGLSEQKRHAVAEIRAPAGSLGVEILLAVNTFSDFDVKLRAATPLDAFQRVELIGVMKPEMVDLRGGFNNFTLGFTGVWRLHNATDFEYSYLVFTPLEKFEKNGIVIKLVKRKEFILDVYGKFSTNKAGIKVNLEPKSKFISQLNSKGVGMEIFDDDNLLLNPEESTDGNNDSSISSSEESGNNSEDDKMILNGEEDENDDIEFLNYIGYIELDTLIWPTIKGTVDIEESEDFYTILGDLQLPQGKIDIKDRLYYPDMLTVNNILKITTPFKVIQDIKVKFQYSIEFKRHYIAGLELSYSNPNETTEIGYFANYTVTTDETDAKTHDVALILKTPFQILKKIHLTGFLELEEGSYKGNFTSKTGGTQLSLGGSLESDDNFLEASVGILLETSVVPHYVCRVFFKKDFSEVENTVDMGFDVIDNKKSNKLRIETMWHVDKAHYVNAKGRVHTNIIPLKLAEISVLLTKNPNPLASFNLVLLDQRNTSTNFNAVASRKKDSVLVEIATPLKDFRNVTIQGTLTKAKKLNEHIFDGNLYRNSFLYQVDGITKIVDEVPVSVKLRMKPRSGGADGIVQFSLVNMEDGYGKNFQMSAIEEGKMCTVTGGYSMRNHLDWDFSFLLQSTEREISRINLNAKLIPEGQGKIHGNFELETPWRHLGIQSVKLGTNLDIKPVTGRIQTNYELGPLKGQGRCSWWWILMENMQLSIETNIERNGSDPRVVEISARYVNPNKNFQRLLIGGKLNADSKWNLEANATLNYISNNDFSVGLVAVLPRPIGDTHRLIGRYRGNIMTNDPLDFIIDGKYETDEMKQKYSTRIHYMNANDLQGSVSIEWGRDTKKQSASGNLQMLRKGDVRKEFSARIATPFYENEDTFFVIGHYDKEQVYHLFVCSVSYPASARIADTDLKFASLSNLKGHVNSTTPFLNVTWLRGDFNFSTSSQRSLRYLKGTWPKDSAYFKLQSVFSGDALKRDLQGNIEMEIPLSTRHYADIQYNLKEREAVTTGRAVVNYNKNNFLEGKYQSQSEQKAGSENNVVDIYLNNTIMPLGIHYIHLKQYTRAENPEYDKKHVQVYQLGNPLAFNITGELHINSTETGQDYKLIAIHPNRTVILNADYDYKDTTTSQKAKVQVSPTAWLGYSVKFDNQTTNDNETQSFVVELSYPKRNLSAEGWYWMTDKSLDSDLSLKWMNPSEYNQDSEAKVVRAGVKWKSEPLQKFEKDHQTLLVTLGHPSFPNDITLNGHYYRNFLEMLNTKLVIKYTDDPEHIVNFETSLKDFSSLLNHRNFTLNIFAKHIASQLLLDVKGSAAAKPSFYKAISKAIYRRSYFPERNADFLALLDMENKEIDYLRVTPYKSVRFWVKPFKAFPRYGINGSIWDSPDLNSTGYFYIDLYDKHTRMEVNLTPDATQNIQMIGSIPDARSAYFDLWRNYDEIRVIDITSYLKMNHSRLISGQFHWRPKMKSEMKQKIKSIGTSFYESFSEGFDFWIRTIYTESMEILNDIWDSSKPFTKDFVDDITGLNVLEEDIEDFRLFVNQSYEANDFYIKTMVNFTITVLDELAIRDHIESLPKILSELWQAMGESGKALRQSIIWLIETIKTTYHKALETISKFLHGESLEHLSGLLQKAVEKYDKFIKDLHISFIKYVENMWNKLATSLSNYWKSILRKIEPHIFRFLHYIETAVWNISKEIFDFIYKRTNEIAESPYFNQVSSFTQDLDRLYKDMKANDAITNFKKYSVIAWNFMKEKYFKLVPFGKELNDVLMELWEEIEALQELDNVQFVIQKVNEVKSKMYWLAEELELEKRLHLLWHLLRNKIAKSTQNALQTDDMYREAKTKFIFDPDVGILDLEQKLPMSWHAFNETPKFEEIPEYKTINDVQNFFAGTNISLFSYLYNLRSHLDHKTWFPPYKAYSVLIGSRHYVTFDKKFVGLNLDYDYISSRKKADQCSYVLAHDFFNRNFTLLLEPSIVTKEDQPISTRKLTLVTDKDIIEINVAGDQLSINGNAAPLLPIKLGDLTMYRDSDILSVESEQDFSLNCNLQFDLCWLELGGWYFGQTAGILGTMNNEGFDDKLTSHGKHVSNELEFINSWSLKKCRHNPNKPRRQYPTALTMQCEEFFKTPLFSTCFEALDPMPFYEMCLDMGVNSISSILKDSHPAQKGACTAALGYIEACAAMKVPLRIPDQCVHCSFPNGSYVPEGAFIEFKDGLIPKTSDVVFIVEAKPCNRNITIHKNIMTVVNTIDQELTELNITNNRYAVVAFGGNDPFDRARSIVLKNKVFTGFENLKPYFDHIETSNGTNNDVFQALNAASKLIFRPGASKTFILVPCSRCSSYEMRLDYSSLLQLMLEEGINLHILMDKEFEFDKTRLTRIFFGMDRELAYSKRDLKEFRGDQELRKQVRLPKEGLGSCTPLAIETNGSIFTSRKLRPEKRNPIKKFATIFAKRVAKTAAPNPCQVCECTGHNTGVAYMSCTSCSVPSPLNLDDYDPEENGGDSQLWDTEEDEEEIEV